MGAEFGRFTKGGLFGIVESFVGTQLVSVKPGEPQDPLRRNGIFNRSRAKGVPFETVLIVRRLIDSSEFVVSNSRREAPTCCGSTFTLVRLGQG